MKEFTYEVTEHIANLGTSVKNGWTRQVNRVSWNKRPAKIDIREWSQDNKRMGKGITLSDAEAEVLIGALKSLTSLE